MGGGLALHFARQTLPPNVCGIFSMGSFVVDSSALLTNPLHAGLTTPFLMMHGKSFVIFSHVVLFMINSIHN